MLWFMNPYALLSMVKGAPARFVKCLLGEAELCWLKEHKKMRLANCGPL